MVQKTDVNVAHQVPTQGGTYDGTSPQYGSAIVYVDTTKSLQLFETNVHVTAAVTVTLPPVAAAAGMTYVISTAAAATIADRDDSFGWSDITTADTEVWVLISNGVAWAAINGNDAT